MASLPLVADYGSSSESGNEDEGLEEKNEKIAPEPCIASAGGNLLALNEESDGSDNSDGESEKGPGGVLPNPLSTVLPSASELLKTQSNTTAEPSGSVFINPFQRAEEAKLSILEKHVKLTVIDKTVKEIGGKRVCKHFRLGRCKQGHKCPNAHDGDIPLPQTQTDSETDTSNQYLYRRSMKEPFEREQPDDDNYFSGKRRKRRGGVNDHLQPPKQAMKMLQNIRSNERPWTMNK